MLDIYRSTAKFPPEEKYGLTSQIRRAAVSVGANIVEGFRRISVKEGLHFYDISNASLEELRYEVRICFDLNYLPIKEFDLLNEKTKEVSKLLNSWIQSQIKNTKRAD